MSYKSIAINAAKVARDYNISPEKTWKLFVEDKFPTSTSQQIKGCPKNTFLGLCREGKIKGIPKRNYTRSDYNVRYAITAITILNNNPNRNYIASTLWKEVMLSEGDPTKHHNGQMDVVLGLWNEDLIII